MWLYLTMVKKTYHIDSKDQLEALTGIVRHDILDRLTASGPLSVRELAAALGRRPTAIYHHLKSLEALGLICTIRSATEGDPGRPAALYQAAGRIMRATRAARDPENFHTIARLARAAATQASRDYARAFGFSNREGEGAGRNHTFYRAVCAPSPQKLARINVLLQELSELVWEQEPNPGPVVSIAFFMAPLRDQEQPRRPGRPRQADARKRAARGVSHAWERGSSPRARR